MPSIERQEPPKAKVNNGRLVSKKSSVIDRIRPVSVVDKLDKTNIYGRSGSGKTTLACTWPKPILIIGTEDGTKSVQHIEDVFHADVAKSYEIDEIVHHVRESGKYRTVVVDTVTKLQLICLTEILGLEEIPKQLSWGLADRDQYGQAALKTKVLMTKVMELANERICHALFLAQEKEHEQKQSDELIAPSVMSALSESVVNWLNPECDFIYQTYVRQKVALVERVRAGKKVKEKVVTDEAEFCVRTYPSSVYASKMRGANINRMPKCIVDPSYSKLEAAIKKSLQPVSAPAAVAKK